MRPFTFTLLFALVAPAYAEDFESRFDAAKIKGKGPEFANYMLAQARRIRAAARPCAAGMSPGSTQSFRFVTDISPEGAISNFEMDQQSQLTACFRDHVSTLTLAPPPKSPFVFGAEIRMQADDGL